MDRDRDRHFIRKRTLSFLIVSCYVFFEGCEYVVILPSAWDYLQTLGVTEEYWLGFIISIYSFAAALAGVIGGRLADKYYQHTKAIVVGSIVFRAIGNFLYMLGISKWYILSGRLLCGMGTAAGTALMAEVCRTTQVEERTMYLSITNAMFQVGILVGPGLQFILTYFDFTVYGIRISPLNAPGLFMALLWLGFWVAAVLMFHNLTEEFRDIEERKKYSSVGGRGSVLTLMSESVAVEGLRTNGTKILFKNPKEESNIYKKYMDEFLTDSFVLLMSMLFALYFSPMCFETVIPIITQDYFGFSVNEITFIYMAGGIESVVTFAVVALIGKYVRETTLQIVGLFLMLIAEVWLIVVMPNFEKGNPTHVIYFLGGIFLIYLGSPIASIANTALSSKVLSNETQGLGQGIRRLVGYLGLILAPTWAGSSVKMPYLFLGVCLALLTFNAIMLLVSCRGLRKKEDDILESSRQNLLPEDEVTPLLRSII